MKIGYARNANQVFLEKQVSQLAEYGLDEIVADTTGDKLQSVLERLNSGDSLHIVSLDRLTRDFTKANEIIECLKAKNVDIYLNGKLLNKAIDDFMSDLIH